MERVPSSRIVLLAIAAAIVIVLLSIGQYRSLTSGLNPVREGFYLAERIVTGPFRFAASVWTDYVALVNTRRENKELRRQMDVLRFRCQAMRGLERENEKLRAMLDFRASHPQYRLEPARVVAQDITAVFRTMIIDRGRLHGVSPDTAVVAPEGLVGRVTALTPHTSQVLLVTDPTSSVPAVIEQSGVKGIVKGTGNGLLNMEYVRNTELVGVGEVVMTSGLGGRFPVGIRIGQVVDVKRDPKKIFLRISVRPSVEMSKIDSVFGVCTGAQAAD
jgi:rod shape-determining protein MreC